MIDTLAHSLQVGGAVMPTVTSAIQKVSAALEEGAAQIVGS